MSDKRCVVPECGAPLPDDSTHKYCEACSSAWWDGFTVAQTQLSEGIASLIQKAGIPELTEAFEEFLAQAQQKGKQA